MRWKLRSCIRKFSGLLVLLAVFFSLQQTGYADTTYNQPEKASKPIVLLLVDTSASMLLTADKHNRADTSNLSFSDNNEDYMVIHAPDYMPECNAWYEGIHFFFSKHYEYSRFMEVIQYIIGDIKGMRPWDAPIDPNHPNYLRYMCRNAFVPRMGPGRGDSGYKLAYEIPMLVKNTHNFGHTLTNQDFVPDGLVELLGTRARVGLMFMDNDPSPAYSFGPDNKDGTNYGVLGVNAPYGGMLLPPDTDDAAIIAQANLNIISKLFKWLKGNPMAPHGGSPLGSMLADAYYYFTTHPQLQACTSVGQKNCDRYHDCRPKYVVLFTDGFMNIDNNSVLQGSSGWPKKLHDIGVMTIVVTPDGSTHQLYETDTPDAYTNVMGQIADNGGSHWVAANGGDAAQPFIFGMPEFDPGVDSFYPNDTDGTNDYAGRESMVRNIGRPYLANLLGSGAMVNANASKMYSNRRYISDLAFTDETAPTTNLASDPGYIDHYAGVIAGGFYQRGFKLAGTDQVDLNVAGNLGDHRITMFGAPYDDGGMHLTFYSCKDHPKTKNKDGKDVADDTKPGVSFSVDTDSRDWRYANTDVTTNQMKLYTVVYGNGNTGFVRELLTPMEPPEPADLGVETPPWTFMSMAFRPGDEDTNSLDWHHEFGAFISGLGKGSWSSKLLNVHTGGTELRWIPQFANPNDPMLIRRMNTLISFLAGRPLHCENNSDNTHQDSDCGGGFGYVNTGWYAYGAGSDRLRLYNYLGNPAGGGSMLVRFGPIGHFAPVFVGHLMHSASSTPGFQYFKDHIVNDTASTPVVYRPTTLYVQTRDGILHEMAINALPGETPGQNHHRELWRFIPGSLLNKVKSFQILGQTLSDGPISVAPVLLSKTHAQLGETAEEEAARWHIVLVAGIGYNDVSGNPMDYYNFENGVYALDVTDPLQPHLLWEITNKKRCQGSLTTDAVTCYTGGEENNFDDLGFTTSKPVIGTVHLGDRDSGRDVAVAIFGAGAYHLPPHYYYARGKAIFIVDLETGQKIAEISYRNNNVINHCSGIGFDSGMISGLSCYPTGPNKIIRQCVAVDAKGKMWLINLSGGNPPSWKAYMAFDPYQGTKFNLNMNDPQRTGTFKAPILTRSADGSLYAIYASETSINNAIDDFSHINFVADTKVEIPTSCPGDLPKVWVHFFDQAGGNAGERVQGRMALFGGDVYLTTYTPAQTNGCIPGTGKIISVSAMDNDNGGWHPVKALTDDSDNAASEVSLPQVIPNGLLLMTLPACIQGLNGNSYSTNLPGGGLQLGSNMPAVAEPQVMVPMGSAGPTEQIGSSGHNENAQTEFLPAKVIKAGNGGGIKSVVIPTSWSLIFD